MAGVLSILMVEDDDGHATLVRRNLKRAGLASEPVHLRDGQELLDYVFLRGPWTNRPLHESLAMFVLTTTDNQFELDRCYALGAAACLVKPVDYGAFGDMVRRLAEFLMTASLPGELPAPSTPHDP